MDVMEHIEENILERYLRRPERLDASVVQTVRAHLESCAVCANTLDFLKAFYNELDGHAYVRTQKANAFVNSLFPPSNVIPLRPLVYKPDTSSHDSQFITVLAADTATQHRYSSSLTLHSEEENIVARILYDKERDSYKLFVVSDDVRKREYVVVSFPELSVECVTDKNGFVEFKLLSRFSSRDVNAMQAVLFTPVTKMDFVSKELGNHNSITRTESDHTLTLRYEKGTLHINVAAGSGKMITRALITDNDERNILVSLQNGEGSCSIGNISGVLTIRLYG